MKKVLLLLLLCSLSWVGYGQSYCTPSFTYAGYSCAYYGMNITGVSLNGESGTSISDAGSCDGSGYINNTSMTATLYLGQTYTSTVGYGSATMETQAWIDYSNNGVFESSETVWSYSALYYSSLTYNFTVPISASTGNRRMRVLVTASYYGYTAPSLDPCPGTSASYYYGEARDYTVNIQTPPPFATVTPSPVDFGYVTSGTTSASRTLTLSGLFLSSGSSPLTVTAPTDFEISSSLGGTYSSSYTISYTGTSTGATSVFARFVAPSTAGTSSGSFTVTGGGITSGSAYLMSGVSAAACSGTVSAGSAVASPGYGGPSGTSFSLSLSGASATGGLTYQWQSATSAGGTYSNISGATNYTYNSGSLTSSRYYRCVVTCTASSSTATSSAAGCPIYCTPNWGGYGGCSYTYYANMTGFYLNGTTGSISDANGCTGGGYVDRSSSMSCTLRGSLSYTVTVGNSAGVGVSSQVWIDFNDNGTFESTESVGGRSSFSGSGTFTITLPTTANPGTHRMRVYYGTTAYGGSYGFPNANPCGTGSAPYYGEHRDYAVTTLVPPPTVVVSPTTMAFGGVVSGSSSSAIAASVSGTYLTPATGTLTVTAPSMYEVSTTGTSGWSNSFTLSYSSGTYTGSIYVRFSPTSTGTRTGTVDITDGGLSSAVSISVSGFGASSSCSSRPSPGTASSSPTSAGTTTSFTLSLPGLTPTAGLSYQWRSSSTGTAGSFTAISGATNLTYTQTGISGNTYFDCIVTCTGTGDMDSASYVMVTYLLPSASCSPTSSSFSCSITGISSLAVPGELSTSISDGSACSGTTAYTDRSGSLSCTLYKGTSYTITITPTNASYSKSTNWWIDFNNNGAFESTESVVASAGTFTSAATRTMTIPTGAPSGIFRMRAALQYNSYPTDPCSGFYIEFRDYRVTITNPPPRVVASPVALDFGVRSPSSSTVLSSALTGSFLVPTSGTYTITSSSSNYGVGTSAGGSFSNSYTVSYSGAAFSSSVFVQFNAPSTVGTYTGTVSITGGGLSSAVTIPLTCIVANSCTGTPTAGTAAATVGSVVTGSTATMSVTGASTDYGVGYQWQSSTTSGGTFSNISGATNASYTTGSLSSTTYYRCRVTCSFSGSSANTNEVTISVYCRPSTYYGSNYSSTGGMNGFRITGSTGSITDAASGLTGSCCTGALGYQDRTSLSCSITQGVTYISTIVTSTTTSNSFQVWIDFNDNGTFASSESVGGNASFTGNGTASLAIPLTAALGTHRMRVSGNYGAYGSTYNFPNTDPCRTIAVFQPGYGESRDYLVTIVPPPPVVTASPASVSFAAVAVSTPSAGSAVTLTGSYLLPSSGNITVSAPSYFEVSPDNTTWYSSYTVSYTGAALSGLTYIRITPPGASTFSGSVTVTGGGLSSALNIPVSGSGATACSGSVTAGTAVSSPTSGSSVTSFTLSLTGTTAAAGLTYQWQSSATGTAGSFTSISGASSPTYVFSGLTATTYFRCRVACPASSTLDSSSTATVTFVLPSAACTPSFVYGSYCNIAGFSRIRINGEGSTSFNDASSCAGAYQNRTSLSVTLFKARSYTVSMNTSMIYTYYNNPYQFWIDFNGDGTFQSTETVGGGSTNVTSSTVVPFTITIPSTVPSGTFRMRGLISYVSGVSYPGVNPCSASGQYYGEGRDYTVTIQNPPPMASAAPASLDFGAVATSTTSSALSTAVTGLFLLPTSGALTVTAPTNFQVCSTSSGTYVNSYTISYSSGTASAVPVFVQFVAPSTAAAYTGSITVTGGGLASTLNIPVLGTAAVACTGTPTAGTASAPTAGVFSGGSLALTLTGFTLATGITFQWQSATTIGGTYSNISGATNTTFTATSITSTRFFRCVVTCTNSGLTANSNIVACPIYCATTVYYGGTYATTGGMNGFSIVGVSSSISDAASAPTGTCSGFLDRSSLSVTLRAGSSYTATLASSATTSQSCQAWIDFNDDGTFQSTETVGGSSSYTGNGTFSVAIPTTSLTGTHRMRVSGGYGAYGASYNFPNIDPCRSCGYPYYGGSRDYTVVILPPPPAVTASPTSLAFGGVVTGTSSSPQSVSLSGLYLTPTSGTLTITAPSNFQVSSTGSSGWVTSYTVSYSSGTYAATNFFVQFNPTASTSYTGSVTIVGGGSSTVNVPVTGTGAAACSGTPTAGTTVASPTSGGLSTSFTMSLSGTSSVANLAFQWQSSTTGAVGSYTNISGATNPSYGFTGLSNDMYFRCVVNCPGFGSADTSTARLVTYVLPTAGCSFSSTYFSCSVAGFSSVRINGESSSTINDATSCSSAYADRTSSTSVTLFKTRTYTVTVAPSSSGYTLYHNWWIDFNADGTFQTTESVVVGTAGTTGTANISITIPSTVPSGVFRMRGAINYYNFSALNPCSGYYAEARDYKVIISNPPPQGTASPVVLSFGNVGTSTTSSSLTGTVTGSFLVPASGTLTITAPTNFAVCSTTSGTFVSSYTLSYSGSTLSSTSVFVRFNAPSTVGTYTGTVTISGGGLATALSIPVTGNAAVNCSGTPTAGTAVSSVPGIRSGGSAVLSITGATAALGLTYQWQSATSAGGTYSNISGATNATHTVSGISSTTFYRCVVTCSFSSSSSNTSVVAVPVYCTPSYYYASIYATTGGMNGFTMNGSSGSIADVAAGTTGYSTGYQDRTSLSCTIQFATSYTVTIRTSATTANSCQVWIDFNDDGTFQSTEVVGGAASYTGNFAFTITLPSTVPTGLHRMRVSGHYAGYGSTYNYPNHNPCLSGVVLPYYGEFRDYSVNVIPPPPAVTALPTTLAFGGVAVGSSSAAQTVNLTGSYLLPTSGSLTVTAPSSQFEVSTTGTSGWANSVSFSYSSGTLSTTPVYVRFSPSSTGSYTGSVAVTGGGLSSAVNVAVSGNGAFACSGTPTAGTAVATPTSGTGATVFNVTLTGTSSVANLTFQWQSSNSGSVGSFSNISGATSVSYGFTGLISDTWYRCVVTCPGFGTDTSSNVRINFTLPAASCTTAVIYSSSGYCSYGGFSSVRITGAAGTSIVDDTSCVVGAYQDRTSRSVTLYKSSSYSVSMTSSGIYGYTMYSNIWIDFSGNGTFESSELVNTSAPAFTTSSVYNISIPSSVPQGTYRMRAFINSYAAPTIPCGSTSSYPYYYGEGRDYKVVILNPPPAVIASPTSLNFGTVGISTTSSSLSTSITGSFLLPTSGSVTITAPTNYVVCSTSSGTYVSSYTVSYTGGTISSSSVFVRFNAPASTGTYPGSITVTGGGLTSAADIPVTGSAATSCTGTPSAGTCVISPSSGTSSTTFVSSLSGASLGLGFVYQWQQSTSGVSGSFTDISGATNATYSVSGLSSTTFYQCVMTCSFSGGSVTSGVVQATVFCQPSFLYGGCSATYLAGLSGFRIRGVGDSIMDGTGCTSGTGYRDQTAMSASLRAGATYTATVLTATSTTTSVQIWIDFDNDGTFSSGESVAGSAGFTGNLSTSIAIPITASTGARRMRVVNNYYYAVFPSMDPCPTSGSGLYYYGEARDYTVNILTPLPLVTASPTSVGFGGVAVSSTSAAQSFSITGNYLVPSSGTLTVTAPTNYQVSTTGTSGWGSSVSYSYGGGSLSATSVFVRFTPPSSGSFTGSVTITGGGLVSAVNVVVSGTGAAACSSTPTAGTASISPTSGGATTPFTLSLSGTTAASGLTYQWQSAASSGGTYSSISGATNPSYGFTGISGDAFFRCVVTCPSFGSSNSSVASASFNLPTACTPSWTYTGYCYVGGFSAVSLVGSVGSISDAASCTGSGYQDRTSLSTTIYNGSTYTVSMTTSASGYTASCQFYIDYDGDASFVTSESIGGVSSFSSTGSFTFTVPAGVAPGTYRMRGVSTWSSYVTFPSISACPNGAYPYYYGEVRDYKVVVTNPPPSVAATPGSLAFGSILPSTTSTLSFSMSGTYMLPSTGSVTVTAPSNYQVSSDGSTWVNSYASSYTGATISSVPVFVRFSPPSAGTYAASVTITGGGLVSTVNVPVTGNGASACSGTPTAGTAAASPTVASISTPITLSVSGTSAVAGLAYQWQSSTDSVSFSNIAGATNPSHSFTGISTRMFYRVVVTCTGFGSAANSSVVRVNFTMPTACTPSWQYSSGCGISGFSSVGLVGLTGSISDAASCTSTGYQDRTSLSTTLARTRTYTISVSPSTSSYTQSTQWYLDYSGNGTFETSESIGGSTSTFTSATTFTFTVPLGVSNGMYRLRGIITYSPYVSFPSIAACPNGAYPYSYGEARDYTVNIVDPPATFVATPSTIAFGGVLTGGTSSAQMFYLTGTYLTPSSGSYTVTAPTYFEVSRNGSTWASSYTASYTGSSVTDSTYVRFSPPFSTSYSTSVSITGGGLSSAVGVNVTGTGAGACSSRPTAGTAAITPTTGSSSTTFSLSLSGTTLASGLTYQWRSATASTAGPYSDIAGATNPIYTTSGLTRTTYFKCFVTCPSNGTDSSSMVTATWALPTPSCTGTFLYTSCGVSGFSSVTLNGGVGSISDGASCSSGNYQDRTSLSCTIYKGATYTVTFNTSATYTYTQYSAWYIDYNGNGTFETSELATSTGGFTTISANTATFSVPTTVPSGAVRMRGIVNYQYAIVGPCPTSAFPYYYGNVRDYMVNITDPPPAIVAAPTSVSFGGVLTGTSSTPRLVVLTGSFLVPSSGTVTVTAPSSRFEVSRDGSTWVSSYVVSYTGAAIVDSDYIRFSPVATGSFTDTVRVTGGGLSTPVRVVVNGTGAGSCSGTPFAGTAASSPSSGASGTTFNITLSGTTLAGGLTYQWQSSPTGSAPWTPVSGATNNSYSFSGLTATTRFRCVVVCPGSSGDTSSTATATFNLPTPCTPAFLYGSTGFAAYASMQGFSLNGAVGSLSDAAAGVSTGYQDRTSLGSSCFLLRGTSYTATVSTSVGSGYTASTQVWIDLNDDGTFSSGETVGGSASFSTSSVAVTLTLSGSAAPGLHRMRVMVINTGYGSFSGLNPCPISTTYYYGEARDYLVNVVAPSSCGSSVTVGTASASPATVCSGLTSSLSVPSLVGVSGLTYQWQSSSTGAGGSFTAISGATGASHTVTVAGTTFYNLVATCTSSSASGTSGNALVTALPSPGAITGSSSTCIASTTTLSNSTSGGTWSSSNPSIASITSGGVVRGNSAGTCVISYTNSGCAPATMTFSVNNTPGSISGFSSICSGASATLTNSVGGGTWSSADTTIAFVNPSSGLVNARAAGTTTITYSNGCGTAATRSWTTNAVPSAITGPTSICISSSGTFSSTGSGITWSNTPTTVGTIDASTGVMYTTTTTGTSVVTATIGFCSQSTTVAVSNNTPAPITGTTSACAGSTSTLFDTTSGGAWSSADPSIATVNFSTGVVTGVSSGSTTITYSTGCGSPATTSFTVNGSSVSIASSTACSQGTLTITSTVGSGSYTYNWSGPLGFSSASATATISNVATGRSGVYTLTATQAGCSASASLWVSVDSTPVVSINASPASICPGGTSNLSLSVTSPAAGTSSYDVSAIPYAPVSISSVTAGPSGDNVNSTISLPFSFNLYGTSYTSAFISTNGYLNFGTSSTTTTVSTLPSSSSPTAMIALFFHDMNAASGSINYGTLGSSPNRRFIVNFNNVADRTGGGRNTGQIVLYESTNVIDMFISKANTAGTYNGVCGIQNASGSVAATVPGQNNVNYRIDNLAGNAWRFSRPNYTYSWSPATSLSSTTSTSPVSSGLTASQTFTVTSIDAFSGCTTGNVSNPTVNVYSLPLARTITPSTGCTAGTTISVPTSQTGVNYQLFRNDTVAVGSPVAGTGSTISFPSVTTAGTYKVVGSLAVGGCSTTMTGTTVVSESPTAVAVTGGSSGCTGSGLSIGVSGSSSSVSYALYRGASLVSTLTGTGSSFSFGTYSIAGTYTVVATGLSGGCVTDMTGSATVNTTPTSFTVLGGNACSATGVTVGLSGSESGISYQLYRDGTPVGGVVSGTGSSLSFGLHTTAGRYEIGAVGAGSCAATMNGVDTVFATPAVTVGGTPNVCTPATSATLTYSSAVGTPTSYSIAWGSTALGAGFTDVTSSLGSTIPVSLPTGATGTFNGTLTVSNGACTSSAYSVSVVVYPYPTAAITSASTTCAGYTTVVEFTGTSGATASYMIDGGSLLTTPLTGGTATLTTAALYDTALYTLYSVYNPGCADTIDSTAVIVPVPMQWNGGVSGSETDWSAPGNWSCGFVPTAVTNVLIPAGSTYMPVVFGGYSALSKSLTVPGGATVRINSSGSLNVKDALHLNGAVNGAGVLRLNGGVSHTITGDSGIVNNLDVDDAAGATIQTGSLLRVRGTVAVSNGTFNTSDSLIMVSNSSATARVVALPSGSSITGNVRVQQYVPGGNRKWRFWAHPFSTDKPLDEIQRCVDITGPGGAANGFTSTGSNSPSAYWYNPLYGNSALGYDPGWRAFTSALPTTVDSNKVHRYQGFRIFLRGRKGEGLGFIPYVPSDAVIMQSGPLNQGTQNVRMTKGTSTGQDFNLLGNPYASPVDIGTVIFNASTSGRIVGSAFYVWNPYLHTGGGFEAIPYSTGGSTPAAIPYYLQANAAFEVRTANNNDSLVFNESHKGSTPDDYLFKALPEFISLAVYDANYNPYDRANVQFNDNATDREDARLDARKRNNEDFNFYSLSSDGNRLSIDARPYSAEAVVPMGVTSQFAGDFIIKAENVSVPAGTTVYLHDKFIAKYVALTPGTEYKFSVTKDAASQGDSRFELSLKPGTSISNDPFAVTVTPNPASDDVKISFNADARNKVEIRVMDMSGVSVYHTEIMNKQTGVVTVPLHTLASGVYMVELINGENKVVKRLIKQ
jgi:hypothetical protein